MKIKSIFGFCSAKDCKCRYDYEAEITVHTKTGKQIKRKIRLCHKHAMELIPYATRIGVTYENTIELQEVGGENE
ncbi:MAG: hypothetical protein MR324_12250 [Lachnospiraceae bacterium]|nr:hypothetical protein [Lachnospiraceae bacterium]